MADNITASIVTICDRVKDIIVADASALGITYRGSYPDVPYVFYGDQEMLPGSVVVCVEPSAKRRQYNGAPFQLLTTFAVQILAYVAKLTDDETARRDCDQLAEGIEHLLHNQATPGQLLDASGNRLTVNAYVSSIDYGYTLRNGGTALYRSANITYELTSKTSGTLP